MRLLCRYKSGRRKLSKRDQLTLEFAGVYRHYHAAFMRTMMMSANRPSGTRSCMQHVAMRLQAVEGKLQGRQDGGRCI